MRWMLIAAATTGMWSATPARANVACEWQARINGGASDLSASPATVWVAGGLLTANDGFSTLRWKNGRFENEGGAGVVRIAAGAEQVWGTDARLRIKRLTPAGWQVVPGELGSEIAVGGAPEEVYLLGVDLAEDGQGFEILKWDGSAWTPFGRGGAEKIAVDPSGLPVIVRKDGTIARWTGDGWQDIPGQAREIAVGANGAIWKLGFIRRPGGHSAEFWDGTVWQDAPGRRASGTQNETGGVRITVAANGQPWLVDAIGKVWEGRCTLP